MIDPAKANPGACRSWIEPVKRSPGARRSTIEGSSGRPSPEGSAGVTISALKADRT